MSAENGMGREQVKRDFVRDNAREYLDLIASKYGASARELAVLILTGFALYPGQDISLREHFIGKINSGELQVGRCGKVWSFLYTRGGKQHGIIREAHLLDVVFRVDRIFYNWYYSGPTKILQEPIGAQIYLAASHLHSVVEYGPTMHGPYASSARYVTPILQDHLVSAMALTGGALKCKGK